MMQPEGEPPETLRNTISKCKKSLKRQGFRDAAAVFLISQVGNSERASAFLKGLEDDEEIGDMVFCSTENLGERLASFQHINDKRYTAWVSTSQFKHSLLVIRTNRLWAQLQLIELFLAALDKQTKR